MSQSSRDPLTEVLLGLRHPHEDIRHRAAIALGPLVTPDLAGRLTALLWDEPDAFVRESLTWVLTRVPEATLPYALAAFADERAQVRVTALHLVSKLGAPRAVPAVIPLTADADDGVAAKARFALARLGDPTAIPALTAYLARGGEERQAELTRDLASFGAAALPQLEESLAHHDGAVREHAARVIDVIRGEERRRGLTLPRRQARP